MSSEARDPIDAQLIGGVAAALRRWQHAAGQPAARKVLREAVWFFWQTPRLARPPVAGKYPRSARWSWEASDLAMSADGAPGQLVIEHIEPMHRLRRRLIDAPYDAEEIAADLASVLRWSSSPTSSQVRCPIRALRMSTYREAGVDLDDFRPLDEWEAVGVGQAPRPDELSPKCSRATRSWT